MTSDLLIQKATQSEALEVASMVGELLAEIMTVMEAQLFDFSLEETKARLIEFLVNEKYFVFLARHKNNDSVGFIALYESYSLYAGGIFGTIPELYVRPMFRSNSVGRSLLVHARALGRSRGWTRLEVTTPPLPQFEKTLKFYEGAGFVVTWGRKMKLSL